MVEKDEQNLDTLDAEGITLEGFTATNAGSSWEHKDARIRGITNHNTISGNNVSNNNYGIANNVLMR